MAMAPSGLGASTSGPPFTSPAQLRAYYGWNIMYPPGQISRVPDGADWPSGTVTGVGGYAQIPGYVGPQINGNSPTVFWDGSGKLLTANQLAQQAASTTGTIPTALQSVATAPSLTAMEDATGPFFKLPYTDSSGKTYQFDPREALSVWWWQSQGFSAAQAQTKAQAASVALNMPVIPISGTEPTAGTYTAPVKQTAPVTTYATPPGQKLPVNTGPTTTTPGTTSPSTGSGASGTATAGGTPALAGFGGWTAVAVGLGLLLAMRKKRT